MTNAKKILIAPLFCCSLSLEMDSGDYRSWLLKSICVDEFGSVLTADPFKCPENSTISKIAPGMAFPYNNFEQMGNQVSDSFPVVDSSGAELFVHNFDYSPFNEFNQHSGSDGYDVYMISDGAVSISNTKDGGGYGSTFYGDGCEFGNGWVLFPQKEFLVPSQDYWAIAGVYWEQNAMAFPGKCPDGYSTDTLTRWDMRENYPFGGVNGNPEKSMDTLISYHGFETSDGVTPTDNFMLQGHLEVFYFTQQYGLTRWEVWVPTTSQSKEKGSIRNSTLSECSGSAEVTFKDTAFTISNCHDWSNVVLLESPVLPLWPVVNANLLKCFHFESSACLQSDEDSDESSGKWHRFGTSSDGHEMNWGLGTSAADDSMQFLSMNCGAFAPDASCGFSDDDTQAIYQDIPISELTPVWQQRFLFGANVRTESGVAGSLSIILQLLHIDGSILWQDVITDENIQDQNGSFQTDSVYLSCKFVHKITAFPQEIDQQTVSSARFLLVPNDTKTFYVVDTFVNPYPVTV